MKINYLDLFSGIGGFPLGLQMAGIEFDKHYFSEIDKYAIQVYKKHFPGASELGDITKIDGAKLGRIDIVSGGFPCQDISIAGKQKGIDGGVRSGLFYQIIRIARDCSPRIIFLENVSNLLSINGGADFGTVLRELASIGYDAEWHCVPASHVGAPHRRDRIWIVAYPRAVRCNDRRDNRQERYILSNKKRNATKGEPKRERRVGGFGAIGEDVADPAGERRGEAGEYSKRCAERITSGCEVLVNADIKRREECDIATIAKGKKLDYRRFIDGWDQWSTEPSMGELVNGVSGGLVRFNGRVATRIPHRVDKLKCLGNAVVPQVVAYLTELIVKPLLESIKEGGEGDDSTWSI